MTIISLLKKTTHNFTENPSQIKTVCNLKGVSWDFGEEGSPPHTGEGKISHPSKFFDKSESQSSPDMSKDLSSPSMNNSFTTQSSKSVGSSTILSEDGDISERKNRVRFVGEEFVGLNPSDPVMGIEPVPLAGTSSNKKSRFQVDNPESPSLINSASTCASSTGGGTLTSPSFTTLCGPGSSSESFLVPSLATDLSMVASSLPGSQVKKGRFSVLETEIPLLPSHPSSASISLPTSNVSSPTPSTPASRNNSLTSSNVGGSFSATSSNLESPIDSAGSSGIPSEVKRSRFTISSGNEKTPNSTSGGSVLNGVNGNLNGLGPGSGIGNLPGPGAGTGVLSLGSGTSIPGSNSQGIGSTGSLESGFRNLSHGHHASLGSGSSLIKESPGTSASSGNCTATSNGGAQTIGVGVAGGSVGGGGGDGRRGRFEVSSVTGSGPSLTFLNTSEGEILFGPQVISPALMATTPYGSSLSMSSLSLGRNMMGRTGSLSGASGTAGGSGGGGNSISVGTSGAGIGNGGEGHTGIIDKLELLIRQNELQRSLLNDVLRGIGRSRPLPIPFSSSLSSSNLGILSTGVNLEASNSNYSTPPPPPPLSSFSSSSSSSSSSCTSSSSSPQLPSQAPLQISLPIPLQTSVPPSQTISHSRSGSSGSVGSQGNLGSLLIPIMGMTTIGKENILSLVSEAMKHQVEKKLKYDIFIF